MNGTCLSPWFSETNRPWSTAVDVISVGFAE